MLSIIQRDLRKKRVEKARAIRSAYQEFSTRRPNSEIQQTELTALIRQIDEEKYRGLNSTEVENEIKLEHRNVRDTTDMVVLLARKYFQLNGNLNFLEHGRIQIHNGEHPLERVVELRQDYLGSIASVREAVERASERDPEISETRERKKKDEIRERINTILRTGKMFSIPRKEIAELLIELDPKEEAALAATQTALNHRDPIARTLGRWIEHKQKAYLELRNKIVEENMGLIYTIAKRYRERRTLEEEDFVHEGVLGMLEAIRKFRGDPKQFSTYASTWIKRNMSNAVADSFNIRVPTSRYDQIKMVVKAKRALETDGDTATEEELARIVNERLKEKRIEGRRKDYNVLNETKIRDAARAMKKPFEIYRKGSIIAAPPTDQYTRLEIEQLGDALERLPAINSAIITLRYFGAQTGRGIDSMSWQDIERLTGTSYKMATRTEQKTLAELREAM